MYLMKIVHFNSRLNFSLVFVINKILCKLFFFFFFKYDYLFLEIYINFVNGHCTALYKLFLEIIIIPATFKSINEVVFFFFFFIIN